MEFKIVVELYLSEENYPGLYDYYERYGYENAQHELMGAHFVNAIADVLAEFDNHNNGMDYYKAMAWGGLKGTASYGKLSPEEKILYEDNYIIEYYNGSRTCIEN